MKILVTGSEGKIGKKVVRLLKEAGHSVQGFDILQGRDITKKHDCEKATQRIDLVVHAAAVLDEYAKNLFQVNVEGTRNILDAAVKNQVERVIHLSSVAVYGSADQALTEDADLNPGTAYEKSKFQAENVIEEYQELIPVTMLRLSLVVSANAAWSKIVELIRKGFPIIGNGKNYWQLVHEDDVASAVAFCVKHEETAGEIYNVTEENASTFDEVNITVRKAIGLSGKPKHIPVWLGKLLAVLGLAVSKITGKRPLINPRNVTRIVKNRWYSIEKIKALGWRPKYTMRQAIAMVVRELQEQKNA